MRIDEKVRECRTLETFSAPGGLWGLARNEPSRPGLARAGTCRRPSRRWTAKRGRRPRPASHGGAPWAELPVDAGGRDVPQGRVGRDLGCTRITARPESRASRRRPSSLATQGEARS